MEDAETSLKTINKCAHKIQKAAKNVITQDDAIQVELETITEQVQKLLKAARQLGTDTEEPEWPRRDPDSGSAESE